jgi:two-component system, cell cycle response regulator DivK
MAKILLVEDEPDIRDLLRMTLELDGHSVEEAHSGEDGIAFALNWIPELILMDLSLGGAVDGLEATRRLRANAQLSGIPIIALTAHAMRGDREKAIAAGCSDHWAKPILDLEQFKQAVNEFAAQSGNGSNR